MARKVETTLVCDITGDPAESTVLFAVDNRQYEIDLSVEALADFNTAIAGFVESARPASNAPVSTQRGEVWAEKQARRERLAKVRAWAAANDVQIAPRGRVSRKVLEAYRAGRPELATSG